MTDARLTSDHAHPSLASTKAFAAIGETTFSVNVPPVLAVIDARRTFILAPSKTHARIKAIANDYQMVSSPASARWALSGNIARRMSGLAPMAKILAKTKANVAIWDWTTNARVRPGSWVKTARMISGLARSEILVCIMANVSITEPISRVNVQLGSLEKHAV